MEKLYPVKTEKTFKLAKEGKYTFAVVHTMQKYDIIALVKEIYAVEVKKITKLIRKGKNKTDLAKRIKVRRPSYKKVYVTLAKGQSLDIFK